MAIYAQYNPADANANGIVTNFSIVQTAGAAPLVSLPQKQASYPDNTNVVGMALHIAGTGQPTFVVAPVIIPPLDMLTHIFVGMVRQGTIPVNTVNSSLRAQINAMITAASGTPI